MSKKNKFLDVKGAVLTGEQLSIYMEKMAVSHSLTPKSNINTYPIPRVKENYIFIENTYRLLNEHADKGIDVYPAGEWLLDNFYIIEEAVHTIIKEMTPKKYRNFTGISPDGFSRIYALATDIVSHTDGRINEDVLELAILSYQRRKALSMEEIWNFWMFLNIAIIENIRNICEKICSAQVQKYKVESILERLIEGKDVKDQKFKPSDKQKKIIQLMEQNQMRSPFIEYMSHRLKQYGRKALPYLNILQEQVNKMGMSVSDVIKKEHFDIAVRKSFYRKLHYKLERNIENKLFEYI